MRNRATNLLDVAIEIVLVCLLAFAPLAFGAVEPWSELVVVAMGAAIAVLLAVRMLLAPPAQRPPRLALIVIAIYIGWAVFQLVPQRFRKEIGVMTGLMMKPISGAFAASSRRSATVGDTSVSSSFTTRPSCSSCRAR